MSAVITDSPYTEIVTNLRHRGMLQEKRMESATTMPILIMGERDEEPCWSCCSVDASRAGAAAAAEAGGGLLSDKQHCAQGKSEADGITQHYHQQRRLVECQSTKVDSVKVSWWSSCCDPVGSAK